MVIGATPIGDRVPAQSATAASILVAGSRSMPFSKQRLAPKRVTVELESPLVWVAVAVRRPRRREAIDNGALVVPRHRNT